MAKVKIWTKIYRPFTMGGEVNRYVATELELDKPVDVGKGYKAYEITGPGGIVLVAESVSGAIVGDSLQMVRDDVAVADPTVMADQVAGALLQAAEATVVTPDRFWELLRGH